MLATRIGGERRSNIPMSGSSFGAQPMSGGLKANWDSQLRYNVGGETGKLMAERGSKWTNAGSDFSGYLGGIAERANPAASGSTTRAPSPWRSVAPGVLAQYQPDSNRYVAFSNAGGNVRSRSFSADSGLGQQAAKRGWGGPVFKSALEPVYADKMPPAVSDEERVTLDALSGSDSTASAVSVLSDPFRGIAGDSGIFGLADAMASKGLI